MSASKRTIDRSGDVVAKERYRNEDDFLQMDEIFDQYRRSHLAPLTNTTLELQNILSNFDSEYYIAQRLKRRPQIIRKLNRLSVRLTQLQDIGGNRIIVHKNQDVDRLYGHIENRIRQDNSTTIQRITDYRERGRDQTGYRSLHVILNRDGMHLELQIRSRIQHYWSESIERTSVIYGYHLKEGEGDPRIISYFKLLSDAFYEIEAGREPSAETRIRIDQLRVECEDIIRKSDKNRIFDSYVNEDIIKTLEGKEKSGGARLNNWILIFDWNEGSFVSWDIVSRDVNAAVDLYERYERQFPSEKGYEVVLIGASEIATVRKTHSHYFGIESYDNILENLDSSIAGFSRKIDIDVGSRSIITTMHRRHFWGKKSVSEDTLRNHFCQKVLTFDSSLRTLLERKFVIYSKGGISLNISKKSDIEQYL